MRRKNGIIALCIVALLAFLWYKYGTPTKLEQVETKKDFTISTMSIGNTSGSSVITKSAKVEWSSNIVLSALTAGLVQLIKTSVWEDIQKWSFLVQLADSQWSATFRKQNAELSISSAQNTYQIQKKQIEKQIQDLLIAKERANISYNNTAWKAWNNTQLQLSGLQKSIEKARLDYDNKLKSDDIAINNNIATAKNIYSDTMNILVDTIDQWDKILAITDTNKLSPEEKLYIWWKDTNIKALAETQLTTLFAKKIQLEKIWNSITKENLDDYLKQYAQILSTINEFIITIKSVLFNSIIDTRYLSQTKLDGLTATFSTLQSRISATNTSITSQTNSFSAFLATYKDQQESLRKQIDILENDVLVKQTQLDEQSRNTSLNLQSSSWNLSFIVDTQNLSLASIENSLSQAQLALREAEFNFTKFSIISPIEWIVADILVDEWQEVSIWTPIIEMVSKWEEINIWLSQDEIKWIAIGDQVEVYNEEYISSGTIVSLWRVADKNGNYPAKIIIPWEGFNVWSFVTIRVVSSRSNLVIPLNSITIIDNNVWQIALRDWEKITTKLITLWSIFGDYAEVKDKISPEYQLITSDISNYDEARMTIKAK
jgi:multidrug resistance efflux pump